MKVKYDFSEGKRRAIDPISLNQTQIMLRLDNEVLSWFKQRVHLTEGGNYQALINQILREYILAQPQEIGGMIQGGTRKEMQNGASVKGAT